MRSNVLAALTASLIVGTAAVIGGGHVAAVDGLSSLPPAATTAPSGSPRADASGEYDACFLVTDSEMEGLFHRSLAMPPSGTRAVDAHDCIWSFGPEPVETAVIWLGAYNGWADLAALMPQTVPGLGDEALLVLGGVLYVRSGDTAFTVMVISDSLDTTATAIAVARLALSRLGPGQTQSP